MPYEQSPPYSSEQLPAYHEAVKDGANAPQSLEGKKQHQPQGDEKQSSSKAATTKKVLKAIINGFMAQKLRITSLGSSFAAGPSIEPFENVAAGRSSRNYAHQLAKRLNADLTDLSVSGALSLNVLSDEQKIGGVNFDPQLRHLRPDTHIVTLTCGGNDIDYIGRLIDQTIKSYADPQDPLRLGAANKRPPVSTEVLTARLGAVLDEIHRIAPNAKVYMVQYLSIIGNSTRPIHDIALTLDHVCKFDGVAQRLARVYMEVSKPRADWVEVVPVAEASREHGLGSPEPWVRGFSLDMARNGPAPFHPNPAGHTAVAEMLYKHITGRNGVARL